MLEPERLRVDQRLDERPFTHPEHSDADMQFMRRIISSLSGMLMEPVAEHGPARPLIIRQADREGLGVRVIVGDRERLVGAESLFVVGFFGHRRPDLDPTVLNAVDEDLIHEFPQFPGVLGYCSFQMSDGNYVNVVLMSGNAAKLDWAGGAKHSYAARELAPEFYTSVRLQNAFLPGGLGGGTLTLLRTKYYDYEGPANWRGLRELMQEN